MSADQDQNNGNRGEAQELPEALSELQADRSGNATNRRWRAAVHDVEAVPYAGPGLWKPVGPAPMLVTGQQILLGLGPDGGEVVDIAVDPRDGPDRVIYLAAGSGGLWKSRDDGVSWQPLTDHLPTLAVGAVALDPAAPDTVYIGTGNLFEGASGLRKAAGLFKSTDGGLTWSALASQPGRPPQAITAAVNQGDGVRVTVPGHGFIDGDLVDAVGLPGVVGSAGEGPAVRIDANTLRIQGPAMRGPAYGGTGATLFDARQLFQFDTGVIRMVCPTPGTLLVAAMTGLFYSADGGRSFGANHPAYDDGLPIRAGLISALEVDTGWTHTVRVADATPADPVVVTAPRHGFATGDAVVVGGVENNRMANGLWTVDRVDDDHFSLRGSSGNGTGATRGFATGPAHPSTKPVQGATNPAAPAPIVVTSAAHGFVTGDIVAVCGVQGNTAANRSWAIRVLTPDTFELVGSHGNGAYTSGGTIDGPAHRAPLPITTATSDRGSTTLHIAAHGLLDGDRVSVLGLPGINAPRNSGVVHFVDADTVRIAGLTMNGTYGGTGATLVGPADSWNTVYFVSAGRLVWDATVNPDRGLFRLTITSTGEIVLSDNLLSHQGGVVGTFGRVAFCQSTLPRTRTLYASVQDREDHSIFIGLFRSDDFGTTWTLRPQLATRAATDTQGNVHNQTAYDLTVGVDPQHSDVVYAAMQQLWRSTDGGAHWPQVVPANHGGVDRIDDIGHAPSTGLIHWDHHELVFYPPTRWAWVNDTPGDPTTPLNPVTPTPMLLGTDGGVHRGGDNAGTMTFVSLNEGLATNLMRSLDMGQGDGKNGAMFTGMQDTGTAGHRNGDPDRIWSASIDGDGGHVAVDSFDPDVVFGFDGGDLIRTTNGGQTWFDQQFNDPITIISVHNENPVRVVTAGHSYRTNDTVAIAHVGGGGGIANGARTITVVNPREFTLNGRDGTAVAAFTDGPQVTGDRYVAQAQITVATLTSPIEIETATPHGCADGQKVRIDGVLGNTAANNTDSGTAATPARPTWTVNVLTPKRLSLQNSDGTGSAPYVSGTGRLRGPNVSGTVPVLRAERGSPIVVTAPGHGFMNDTLVTVAHVGGGADVANNAIQVLDANSFVLTGTTAASVSPDGPRVTGLSIGRGLPTPAEGDDPRLRVALVPNPAGTSTTVYVSINAQLFRSVDGGILFTRIMTFDDPVTALHAPAADRLWVGLAGRTTPFRGGTVQLLKFDNHAPPRATRQGTAQHFVSDVGARSAISSIREDPAVADGSRVVVVTSGYTETGTARRTRHAFLSTTGGFSVGGGAAWTEVGGVFDRAQGNLPDIPIMAAAWEKTAAGPSSLLVASERGVLRLTDPGNTNIWQRVGPNLPNISTQAIVIDNTAAPAPLIRIATYGRSAWEFTRPTGARLYVEADMGFGEQQVGQPVRRRMVLHSVGDATVTVSTISWATSVVTLEADPSGPLTFPIVLTSGQRQTVDVVYNAAAVGPAGTTLEVQSDDPVESSIFVRVTGSGVAAGRPRLTAPPFLEFGVVRSGAPGTLPLEVRNVGNAPLQIDALPVIVGSTLFALSLPNPAPTFPLTVPPGGAWTVDVTYTPTTNDAANAALTVTGSGQGQVVNLIGQGTTTATGMVAVLLNTLGLSDAPDAVV